jgi:hypothetical integral membrane protein (TIGR02206 family)
VQDYEFVTFGARHLLYLAGAFAAIWGVLAYGRRAGAAAQRKVAASLAALSVGQELVADVLAGAAGVWTAAEHLPLHLCSFALFVSAYAVVTRRRLAFELAYFWGTIAATQALLTPDPTRWRQGEVDAFFNFFSHGIIVLNVAWLVLVDGMRPRPGAWLRAFALTNAAAAAAGAFDWATGFNYFFLCRKPGGESPLLIGDWPYYLLVLEALALAFFFLAQQAARLAGERPRAELVQRPAPEGSIS